jgi:hypothetical protein
MALPQQVVEQLNQESTRTPGWSSGLILFAGSILFIVVFIYAGLRFGYEAYLTGQNASLSAQADKVGQSISPSDEANLVRFYSQISNLESLIKNHVFFSQFLTWLERNTEANIYYNNISFAGGDQVTLAGVAKTSADVTQQIAVFEADPKVSLVSLSSVAFSSITDTWTFNAVLTMQHDTVFLLNSDLSSGVPTPSLSTTTVSASAPSIATTTTTTTEAAPATTTPVTTTP